MIVLLIFILFAELVLGYMLFKFMQSIYYALKLVLDTMEFNSETLKNFIEQLSKRK